MKHIFALLFVLMCGGAFAQQTITATEAHFVIDGTTSREELAQLRNELYAQGIELNYNPRFAPDRSLHGLQFSITGNNGNLNGQGEHTKLNHQGSKIIVDINKTNNSVNIQYEGSH